jgi:urease accessory protein
MIPIDIAGTAPPGRARAAVTVRGSATLLFARRGARTVLLHSRLAAPMAIVRPFALPDGRLVVQLVTIGPGLCAGDAIAVEAIAEDGAEVLLTTTAATRVMTMNPGWHAEQHVRLRAGRGASLEYYPALTIPFPGSELRQTLTIEAAPTARIGVVETWALGRAARGEYLRFRSLSSRTSLAIDGAVVYADALQLEPALDDIANAGVLDGRRYLAAGFFYGVGPLADAQPTAGLEPAGSARPVVEVALAQSRPGLAYLRAVADDGPALDAAVQGSIERVARAWDRPAARLDRFRC